ncbi:putative large exoprotein involved in heme utilization or adhesion of ShlA/HecA/FhaA family [Pseudomonas sp. FeS53a]|uniref:hemagglutinin repeat-containing protein n=1 Tax=Pseudomonas sp. FeS53a TaxID=1604022 RepID=UPI0005C84492|nr:putative large exoprotein involved in heme utilization or adhesion of ShlA/HecA/FhaA family [Pseudomonas sp. FeS53a]
MVTGRNDVDATTLAATAKADDGTDKPQLAIDSSALGGMYAGAIRLVGTEQGVGVKLAGDMAASGGDIQIDANGKLTLSQAAASRDIALKAQSIELGNKTYAGRNVKAEAAQSLTLEKDRSLAAGAQIDLKAEQLGNQGVIEAGVNRDNSRNTTGDVKLSGGSLRNQGTVVASRDLEAALTGTLDNRAGAISGKVNTRVAAKALDNRDDGLLLSKGSVTVDAESLDNRKGAIAADQSLNIKVAQRLDNQEGELSSRAATTIDAGQLDNRGGQLSADRTLTVSADALDNSAKGTLSSRGSLVVQKAALNNQGGTVVADQRLDITGQRLDNRGGVVSSRGNASVAVEGVLDNAGPGRVVAEGALQVTARELRNNAAGQVGAKGDVEIKVDTLAQQGGELLSQGHLSLEARQLDNLSGGLIAARQGIDVRVSERLRNSGGEISTQGQADIRAQAIAGQAPAVLDNSQAGLISADQGLTLTVQRLLNHTKGVLTARDRLVVRGESLDNSAGGVVNGQGSLDLTLQGGLVNQQGLITSTAGLHLEAASLDSSQGGEVSSKGDLRLSVARLIQQQGRLIGEAAVHLDLQDGDLDNRGGLLSAKGPLTLERLARLDNRGGELSSRQGYNLKAQAIDNGDQGKLISTGQLDIDLGQGALRNAGAGLVSGWKGLTVRAGSLDNRSQGTLSSRDGDLQITLSGALDNRDAGALVGKGALSVDAQRLDNRTGGVVSSVGDLSLTLADTLDNRTGQISSQQAASIHANRLDNSAGELTSKAAMTLTLTGQLINAQKARLASGGPLVLQAAALDNRGGSLISQQLMKLTTGDLNNAGGTLAARNGLELLLSGVLDNSADGLVHSQQGLIDLQAQRLDNEGGNLSGQQGVVARLEGALNNRSGRLETTQGDLDLRSTGDLDNHGGVLNSLQGGLTVTSGGAFDNASGTAQAQAVTVTAKALGNQGGHLSALSGETRIDLGTGTLQNQGGGLYAHQLLNVIAGDFDNRADSGGEGGKVAAERIDFTLSGALRNGNGLLESSSTLRLAAARIDNQYGRLRALGQAGSTRILGSALDNRNGTLETANAELALDVDDLYGTGGSIVHTGAGRFGLSTAQVMGGGGNLSTQGRLNLSASNWTNSGVLEADQLVLDIGTFTQTASGKLVARQSFSGSGENWTNHGVLASDGSFTLNLSGAYTGQGQLSSLGELTLNTGSLDIASSARIAGGAASTLTVSGLLANQGRITSAGSLTARAGTLDNYGTLGSAGLLRLETPSLLNEKGLIFSGDDMALRVKRFTNRYADVYSLGRLDVALDDAGAWASSVSNLSGNLESQSDLVLRASTLENQRDVLNIDNKGVYTARVTELPCSRQYVGDCKGGNRNGIFQVVQRDKLEVSGSAASNITAGRNLVINGGELLNKASNIAAGDGLNIEVANLSNVGIVGGETQTTRTFVTARKTLGGHIGRANEITQKYWFESPGYNPNDIGGLQGAVSNFISRTESEIYSLGKTEQLSTGDQSYAAVIQAGGGKVEVRTGNNFDSSVIRPGYTYIGGGKRTDTSAPGSQASTVVTFNPQLPPDLQQLQVNPLTLPGFSLPQGDNGLFRLNTQAANDDGASQAKSLANSGAWQVQGSQVAGSTPADTGTRAPSGVGQVSMGEVPVKGHKYLIETNPAFADLTRFLNSDYLLGKLGYDPDKAQKRLGDGLYEQRLIREAVVARTGQRYLAGLGSDEALFRYLMDNAIASKQALNLALGVSLSAEQVAALTHDIVWMEEHEVQGEKVLVPVLYLAQAQGRVAPNGALIQGRDVTLISGGSLNNQGTLKASQNLSASAVNLTNSGSMQAGERLSLLATESIRNAQGGIIAGRDVLVKALSGDLTNERSITDHQSAVGDQRWRASFADSAARIEALNRLEISAGRDVRNLGGALDSRGDLAIQAGRDVAISSVELNRERINGTRSATRSTTQLGAAVSAGRDLSVTAGNDLNVVASAVRSDRDLSLSAVRDVTIASAADEQHRYSKSKKVTSQQDSVTQVGSELSAGGDLSVKAGEDLRVVASQLKAEDEAYLYAGGDLELLAAQNSSYASYYSRKKKGGAFSSSTKTRYSVDATSEAQGSLVSANTVDLRAQNDIRVHGSDVVSTERTSLQAGRDVDVRGVTESHYQERYEQKKKSGLMSSGGIGITLGSSSLKGSQQSTVETTRASTVGSVQGDVEIQAGKALGVTGSDVVAGRDIRLTGQEVSISAAENHSRSEQRQESKKSGLTLALSGAVGAAVNTAYETAQAARDSEQSGDSRMAALQGVKAGLSGYQAWQAAEQGGMTADNASQFVGISLSLGTQKSSSKQVLEQQVSQGSNVNAGRDLSIQARGVEGQGGDLNVAGSGLKAGRDLTLDAARDINLEAAANTQKLTGSNKSSGGNVGISLGVSDSGAGLSIFANANMGRGMEKGSGTTWEEAKLDAGNQVKLSSGRDATLQGAQVNGERIVADIGRDLTLQSLQDSDRFDAKQQNVSAGGSFTFGTMTGSGYISASQSKLKSRYDSVQEQTGLFAGQGGYQIDVGQHTQLDGAVIGSTAEAEKNRLSTGTLGWSDIRNKAEFSSQQQSVGISSSGSAGQQFLGNMASGLVSGLSRNGEDSSSTRAAVSEGQIDIRDTENQQQDVASLNRDVEHAHQALSPIFDKEKEQRRLREVQAIAEIGSQVMDIVRTEGQIKATREGKEALERQGIRQPGAGASADERKAYQDALVNSQAYKDAMAPYGTGGDYQRAAQAVTAALQGLAGGNISAAVAGAAAPYVAQTIKQATGDNDNARLMAHAVLAAVVAKAQGNSVAAGAAGAVSGELMADLIAKKLYSGTPVKDLNEEQRQTISALSTLAAGLAGAAVGGDAANAVAGAQGGRNVVENNALSDLVDAQAQGKTPQQIAAERVNAENERYRKENCAGLNSEACAVKMYTERREELNGILSFGMDFVPVVGDIKGVAEAESALDYLAAAIGLIPMAGDAAGKIIKNAERALEAGDIKTASELINKASHEIDGVYKGSKGNANVPRLTIRDHYDHHLNMVDDIKEQLSSQGYRVSKKEISFGSSCGAGRCRPDIVAEAPDGTIRIIEVKTGNADLSIRQSEIFPQIRDGSSIPRGKVAESFGLTPGVPLKDQGYPNGIPIEIINFPGAR